MQEYEVISIDWPNGEALFEGQTIYVGDHLIMPEELLESAKRKGIELEAV